MFDWAAHVPFSELHAEQGVGTFERLVRRNEVSVEEAESLCSTKWTCEHVAREADGGQGPEYVARETDGGQGPESGGEGEMEAMLHTSTA